MSDYLVWTSKIMYVCSNCGEMKENPTLYCPKCAEKLMYFSPSISKKIVLVDIDGTLSKVGDRIRCLQSSPPDWDTFYLRCGEDEPIQEVINIVNVLKSFYRIVLCSGRRESSRSITEKWLAQNGIIDVSEILLRADGDFRHDAIVKPEMLEKAKIKLNDIAFVIEDRNSMVKRWRELGLVCFQPADGDF